MDTDPVTSWSPEARKYVLDRQHRNKPQRRPVAPILVALVITGAAALVVRPFTHRSETGPWTRSYSAALGHDLHLELTDGSRIDLSSGTAITVTYSREARWVDVLEGEAFFDVQHDAKRPFRVASGTLVMQDIGTSFDVLRRHDGTTRIVVKEGEVRLGTVHQSGTSYPGPANPHRPAEVELHTRNMIEVPENPEQFPFARLISPFELNSVLQWRQEMISFQGEPLSTVFQQLYTYYGVDFDLQEPDMTDILFVGTAKLGDLDAFLRNLREFCLNATGPDQRFTPPMIHLTRVTERCYVRQ